MSKVKEGPLVGRMKPYMAYSRHEGAIEGAILVIAATVKAAKKLAWGRCFNVDDWTDLTVRLIRDESVLALADQDKLTAGIPHVIDDPLYCQACEIWGEGITLENRCCYCDEYPGDALVQRLKSFKE